jgi:hypothetical protein
MAVTIRARWKRAAASATRLLVSASTLAGAGCVEEEPSSTELVCDAVCERLTECGVTGSDCTSNCRTNVSYEELRVDAAEDLSACLGSQGCGAVASEETFRQTFEACWSEMEGSVAATEYGRTFCRSYAAHIYGCGYAYGAEQCEAEYGILTDDALQRLLPCAEQSCENLSTCQSQAIEGDH